MRNAQAQPLAHILYKHMSKANVKLYANPSLARKTNGLCNNYTFFLYNCVLRHVGAIHSHEHGFGIQHSFDSCPRVLTNYHAFRCHLRKKHGLFLKTYISERSNTTISGAEDGPNPLPSLESDPDSEYSHNFHPLSEKRSDAMYILKLKVKYKLA